jgi:hypothetical protein
MQCRSAKCRRRRRQKAAVRLHVRAVAGDWPEAQRIQQKLRPRAHREDIADDATHTGGCALERLDRAWVIVRFDLEGHCPAVANVDDARVLFARFNEDVGPVVGNFFSSRREFLYEQCSLHITEKMPSSVKFGSRPRIFLMRSNSSGVSPCFRDDLGSDGRLGKGGHLMRTLADASWCSTRHLGIAIRLLQHLHAHAAERVEVMARSVTVTRSHSASMGPLSRFTTAMLRDRYTLRLRASAQGDLDVVDHRAFICPAGARTDPDLVGRKQAEA